MRELTLTVGIDVGGTKTRWLTALNGLPQTDRQVPTVLWRKGAYSKDDCLRLKKLVEPDFDGRLPEKMVLGANGCGDNESIARCERTLRGATGWNIHTVNDAELLASTASPFRGISLISGTGSIAVARNRCGSLISAGGWGWLLGDDGGGAGLVRAAARCALAAEDNQSSDKVLGDFLVRSLGIAALAQANQRLASSPSAGAFARHAPAVFQAADHGCTVADSVLARGASALADLVGSLMRRGATGPVFAGGGIFEKQPRFFDRVSQHIRKHYGLVVFLVSEPPVYGALRLADVTKSGASGIFHLP